MTPEFDDDLRRGIDHLQWIKTMLEGLLGAGALANELIQNADDAAGATELTFRFERDHLAVVDNGGFESCGHLTRHECGWEAERRGTKQKKRCDFHAFRKLAGASKENSPDLTGAFGVGFLSVYQVTDQPELFSAGQHWVIDDAEERIRPCRRCEISHRGAGTYFRLPWATERTEMRELLGADPVPPTRQEEFYEEFCAATPQAMLFLRKLQTIRIEHHSRPPVVFARESLADGVRITGPDLDQQWLIFEGSFASEVSVLRQEHPRMRNRSDRAQIALLPGSTIKGLVHATLPTRFLTGLPLHVNGSFFPAVDRKGILLDGPQGNWNLAIINCCARILAERLEPLARRLGAAQFWRLIRATWEGRQQSRRGVGESFAVFWDEVRTVLPAAVVMATQRGSWAAVSETVMPRPADPEGWSELLEDLGIHTVAEDVLKVLGEFRSGAPCAKLTLDRLLLGLEHVGLAGGPFTRAQLPAGLGERGRRDPLRRRLAEMAAATASPPAERLRSLALWRTAKDNYASLHQSWLVAADTVEVFGHVLAPPLVKSASQDPQCEPLLALGDPWDLREAVELLADDGSAAVPSDAAQALLLLGWLNTRIAALDDPQVRTLRALPLLPTSSGLAPAVDTVVPGGFADPFAVTSEVPPDVVSAYPELLERLSVRELSFAEYVVQFVPKALARGREVERPQLCALLDTAANDHRRVVDGDPDVKATLKSFSCVPCQHGARRLPARVYFATDLVHSVLGDKVAVVHSSIPADGAVADLLRTLGVMDAPRPQDIVDHVANTSRAPVSEQGIKDMLRVLEYLPGHLDALESEPLSELATIKWLPAERNKGGRIWASPNELFYTRERRVFELTGTFIALPTASQDVLASVLGPLGVRRQPPPELVVEHVLALLERGDAIHPRIAHWLNSDSHWTDPAVARLCAVSWLPDTDGVPRTPSRVFRTEHDLQRYLPRLAEEFRDKTMLLDALDVPVSPGRHDAIELLLAFANAEPGSEPPPKTDVRACWHILNASPDSDLAALAGARVLLARDDGLYRADEVIVDDAPHIAEAFPEAVRARFVKSIDAPAALRLGAALLSQVARSEISQSGPELDAEWIGRHIRSRQRQIARIVIKDAGRPHFARVLQLAESLSVQAFEWLTVERYLEGFPELSRTEPVPVGAHDMGGAQLVVATTRGEPDWFEIAQRLREFLVPTASLSVAGTFEALLETDDDDRADAHLTKMGYPELDQEFWDELKRIEVEKHHAGQLPADEPPAEPVDEDPYADDAPDPAEGSDEEGIVAGQAQAESDERTNQAAHTARDGKTDPGSDGPSPDRDVDAETSVLTPLGGAPTANVRSIGSSNGTGPGDHHPEPADPDAGEADTSSPEPSAHDASLGHAGGSDHDTNGGRFAGAGGAGNGGRCGGGGLRTGRSRRHGANAGKENRTRRTQASGSWNLHVSGVAEPRDRGEEGQREAQRRRDIDLAGMAAVRNFETEHDRTPRDPGHTNQKGYDLTSHEKQTGKLLRYIEVKALSGAWGDGRLPGLTAPQWDWGYQHPDEFWIYVVEHAESEKPLISPIPNPASQATRYYLDPGWAELGERVHVEPVPEHPSESLVEELLQALGAPPA